MAQEHDDAIDSPDESYSAPIVVTGTRVATNMRAPTPVTVVGSDLIEQRGAATMGEVLQQIPSFGPTASPSTAGVTSRGGAQVNPDLRGLGSSRTLVLVDGRRHVPTAATGSVDIRLIPTLLVDQVEVVTGGASAAYGSDAVAGVVNFILRKKMDGVDLTAQTGISQRGDGMEYRASGAFGTPFADGRGQFMVGVDYLKVDGIGPQTARDWGRKDVGLITNPNYATNGLPNFIISPGVHSSITTPGGLIVSGPLRGTAFNADGTTYQYQFGDVYGSTMIGGDGALQNENLLSLLGTPMQQVNGLARLSYDAADNITVFAELSAGHTVAKGASQEARDRGNLTIFADNAYLPESVRAAMVANGLASFVMGRVHNDTGKIKLNRKNDMIRGVVGAEGEFGAGWSWDGYYQYGRNDYSLTFGPNNLRRNEYRNAVDAVIDPASGNVVCRSTLANPSNGCIPVNVFGDGSLVMNDYVHGSAQFDLLTTQHAAGANLRGEPFETWAGPVSLAVGGEYRRDRAVGTSDATSQLANPNGSIGGWLLGNQLPLEGTINVWELYAETLVPLASGLPWADELNVNGAVRRTHYSSSGTVYTWKLGATYAPIPDIRFRLTRSRDIRAPNITELYEDGGSSNTNVFDPALGQAIQVREIFAGNPNLQPEIANTFTAGVTAQPSFLPGLDIAIDYYDIKIKDAIATLGAPSLAQGCFAGNQLYCDQITFNSDGSIAFITNRRLNLASVMTSGLDFEATYSFPAGADGDIRLHALATRVLELEFTNPNGVQDRLGQTSNVNRTIGVPKWAGNASIGYSSDALELGLQARIVGPAKFSTLYTEGAGAPLTVNDNSIPAYAYFTLSTAFNVDIGPSSRMQFFAIVNNLFDTAPPFIPSGAAGGTNESSTNAGYYDVVGRYFRFGVRLGF